MTDAEVMTTAIVTMPYFKGNICLASRFMHAGGYIPTMLGKSRSFHPGLWPQFTLAATWVIQDNRNFLAGVSKQTVGDYKQAVGDCKQAVGDCKQAVGDCKQAVGDCKQAVGD